MYSAYLCFKMYTFNVKKSMFVWYPCVHSLVVRKIWRLWVHADTSSFWTLNQIPLTLSLSLCSVLVTSQRSAAWPFSLINPAYTHSLIHTRTAGSSRVLGCWVSWKSTEHLIKTFRAFYLMAQLHRVQRQLHLAIWVRVSGSCCDTALIHWTSTRLSGLDIPHLQSACRKVKLNGCLDGAFVVEVTTCPYECHNKMSLYALTVSTHVISVCEKLLNETFFGMHVLYF